MEFGVEVSGFGVQGLKMYSTPQVMAGLCILSASAIRRFRDESLPEILMLRQDCILGVR